MPRQRASKCAIRALSELNGTNYTTALRAFEANERTLTALDLDDTASPELTTPARTPQQASPSLDITFTD